MIPHGEVPHGLQKFLPVNGGLLKWLLQIGFWIVIAAVTSYAQLHFVARNDFDTYRITKEAEVKEKEKEYTDQEEKLNKELRDIAVALQKIQDFMEDDKRQRQAIQDLQHDVHELEMSKHR